MDSCNSRLALQRLPLVTLFLSERCNSRFDSVDARIAGRGNTKASHKFLGVDLAAFKLRRILRRTDDLSLGGTELVDYAGYQRNFRTYDGEIGINRVRRGEIIRAR